VVRQAKSYTGQALKQALKPRRVADPKSPGRIGLLHKESA